MQDDTKSTDALAGCPASSFDVSRAAQAERPASVPFDWISEFCLVHTRRDPATLAVVSEERADLSEADFWRIVALFAGIEAERIDQLSRDQRRDLCAALQAGIDVRTALGAVEIETQVH